MIRTVSHHPRPLVRVKRRGEHWPLLEPVRDLARFVGTSPFPEDGVAYQRRIRDSEWS